MLRYTRYSHSNPLKCILSPMTEFLQSSGIEWQIFTIRRNGMGLLFIRRDELYFLLPVHYHCDGSVSDARNTCFLGRKTDYMRILA
jgi:hypothetical protein